MLAGIAPASDATEAALLTVESTGGRAYSLTGSSYLDRCRVDTPLDVVRSTWEHVRKLRPEKAT